ncbi:MAG: nuclear transport factor 2 family protein [Acidimicrobiales bacterium]
MTSLDEMVQELWDRDRIGRLARAYARGVDRRDWALVRSCFADEAVVEGTRSNGPIDAYLAELRPGVERFASTMHVMANQLIDLDGDRGAMETYAVAFHWVATPAGTAHADNLVVGVRYHDEVVRRGDGWVITHRRVSGDWQVSGGSDG